MLLSTSCQIHVAAGSDDKFTQWTWARECPKCDAGLWVLLPTASLQSSGLCTGKTGLVSFFLPCSYHVIQVALVQALEAEIKFYWQVKQLHGFAWHSGHHYGDTGF